MADVNSNFFPGRCKIGCDFFTSIDFGWLFGVDVCDHSSRFSLRFVCLSDLKIVDHVAYILLILQVKKNHEYTTSRRT